MNGQDIFTKLDKLNETKTTKAKAYDELKKQLGETDKGIITEKGHIIDKICTDKGFDFADTCRFLMMIDIPLDDAVVVIDRHSKMKAHTERKEADTNE